MAHKNHPVFRVLFILATVFSLLLCLATVALWVRSQKTGDIQFRFAGDGKGTRLTQLFSNAGVIVIWRSHIGASGLPDSGWHHSIYRVNKIDAFFWLITSDKLAIHFPHWFAALLFAILPTISLIQFSRRRRRQTIRGFAVLLKDLNTETQRSQSSQCRKEEIH